MTICILPFWFRENWLSACLSFFPCLHCVVSIKSLSAGKFAQQPPSKSSIFFIISDSSRVAFALRPLAGNKSWINRSKQENWLAFRWRTKTPPTTKTPLKFMIKITPNKDRWHPPFGFDKKQRLFCLFYVYAYFFWPTNSWFFFSRFLTGRKAPKKYYCLTSSQRYFQTNILFYSNELNLFFDFHVKY